MPYTHLTQPSVHLSAPNAAIRGIAYLKMRRYVDVRLGAAMRRCVGARTPHVHLNSYTHAHVDASHNGASLHIAAVANTMSLGHVYADARRSTPGRKNRTMWCVSKVDVAPVDAGVPFKTCVNLDVGADLVT